MSTAPLPEGARLARTVLVADLLDPVRSGCSPELREAVVRRTILGHDGEPVLGSDHDAMAVFSDPEGAVRCASALLDAARAKGLRARVGIHLGEVDRVGSGLGGMAFFVGSRVAALAEADEVLVSAAVAGRTAAADLDDRGEHALKGVPGRWRLYAVR